MAGAALLLIGATPAQTAAPGIAEPVTTGGPATFRRLSEEQYKRSIEDIFGTGIKVPGRFDPPLREEGLLAIGEGKVAVSASGIEQYALRAREISANVLAEGNRAKVLSCTPKSPQTFDRECASAFLDKYGRLLYRRPLTSQELSGALSLASAVTTQRQSFNRGLEVGLARLLSSPNFIFRTERSQPDPKNAGVQRLDSYSLATRVSFLLWNAPPDAELLDAAANGTLQNDAGLAKQVDRLIASPRFEQGVRAFFSDMFAYDQFDGLSKDQSIYWKYTSQLAKDAQEQALRTIVDLLVTNKGDYRDLFTTKQTFMNRSLASLYQVSVDDPGITGWQPYTFGDKQPRAGILTLAAFLMLDPTHEGRSSPTIRGKSLRELFLCQMVPPPPANVNFAVVQDVHNPDHKTARLRLGIHSENPVCAGCHALTDPTGLAMENYDAVGAWRTEENGAPIDASGKFEGKSFTGLVALGQLLHDSPTAPSCLAQRAYQYGVGRSATEGEGKWLEYTAERFADDRYAFPALLRRIATSKAFQAVSVAQPIAAKGQQVASK